MPEKKCLKEMPKRKFLKIKIPEIKTFWQFLLDALTIIFGLG